MWYDFSCWMPFGWRFYWSNLKDPPLSLDGATKISLRGAGVRATAYGAISNAEGCCINCAKWVHKVRMVIVDVLWMFSSE